MKKIISLLLVLAMALSCFGVVAFAESEMEVGADAPKALVTPLTKDELNVKGEDISLCEFEEALDFGLNFKALDTPEDLIDNPYAKYSVDFVINFSEDVNAILAGEYGEYGWIAIKAEEGLYDGVTEEGFSFAANTDVRIMEKGYETYPFPNNPKRLAYWEVVTGVKEFNCGVKLTSNKDVKITLILRMYEIGEDGNETGNYFDVYKNDNFEYKAVSIPENPSDDDKISAINSATSINDSNKDIVVEAVTTLPVERHTEIKPEVLDAVAEKEVTVDDKSGLDVIVNTIESKNDGISIEVEKLPQQEENSVTFDIDAFNAADEEIKGELEAPVVVKIPLSAFGNNVSGITALYHEHEGIETKIDFVVKNDYVIFAMNKFSTVRATTTTIAAGEAELRLVQLTDVEEGTTAFDVILKANDFKTIQNFGAGEFVLNVNGTASAEFTLNPEIEAKATSLYQYGNKYVIAVEEELANIWSKDETYSVNNSFKLGTITVTGWGKSGIIEISDIIMNKHIASAVNGGTDTVEIDVVNDSDAQSFIIAVPQEKLNVEVYLAHEVVNQKAPYQDMLVTVTKGGTIVAEKALGRDDVDFDEATSTYKLSFDLDKNANYLVTVTGGGYRKASENVTLTEEKTVNFWSNVDANGETNFLAGDIVGDDIIDIYDLSAVVSYFDERVADLESASDYSRYDLNRDGVINSKDVVIVTNGWHK